MFCLAFGFVTSEGTTGTNELLFLDIVYSVFLCFVWVLVFVTSERYYCLNSLFLVFGFFEVWLFLSFFGTTIITTTSTVTTTPTSTITTTTTITTAYLLLLQVVLLLV